MARRTRTNAVEPAASEALGGSLPHEAYIVPALKRGLQILELFSRSRRVLTVSDFAAGLGVSVSSIYRTVVTLTELHYLKKVGRNSYELGPMVLSRGFCYLASRDIVQVAAPGINALRDETSASCHLAVREGLEAVYLYRAHSLQVLAVNVPIGTRFMCHTVAIGRALLFGLENEELGHLYGGVALDGHRSGAPRSLPELRMLVAREREQGYSVSSSDFSTAFAAPLVNFAGEVVGAVNVSVPDFFITDPAVRQRLTACLLEAAARISQRLGGGRPAA
jgi:DNA-binding IclR family transcriptional regulator